MGVGIGIGLRVKGPRGRKVGDGVGLLEGDDAGRVMALLLFYPSRRVQKSGCGWTSCGGGALFRGQLGWCTLAADGDRKGHIG